VQRNRSRIPPFCPATRDKTRSSPPRALLVQRRRADTLRHMMVTSELRSETEVDTGLEYRSGERVLVRVMRRPHRVSVTDDGAAVEKAGHPPGWRAVAAKIDRELVVNVSRHGVVSLPVVAVGPGLDAIVRRVGDASLALYQELLELQAALN
jgi:hypothetical protein